MAHKTPTERRAARVRRAVKAAANGRMRLSVHRSSKHIYAQVIDDLNGVTLVAASTLEKAVRESGKTGADTAAATHTKDEGRFTLRFEVSGRCLRHAVQGAGPRHGKDNNEQ